MKSNHFNTDEKGVNYLKIYLPKKGNLQLR